MTTDRVGLTARKVGLVMKKRKYMFPMALFAVGMRAFGEYTNVSPNICTTVDCLARTFE